ncbi:MAG: hypothetical protein SGPRY_014534, partial [Prymnesium sp.]
MAPVVCVPGFLALGEAWEAERLRERYPSHTFLILSPSPLASHHDRAVQIFYALKGGVADYGAEHSKRCSHARYGRSYAGVYPEWDEAHPVHLLGHSIGGQTIRVLQHLLATGAFPSHKTSERWVYSVSALSTPFNGDWAPFSLGAQLEGTAASPLTRIRWGSVGWALTMMAHLLCFVGASHPDLQLDHWRLSAWEHGAGAFRRLLCALLWWPGTSVGQSSDNAAYEVCYHNSLALNQKLKLYPTTHYFSFISKRETMASALRASSWLLKLSKLFRVILLNTIALVTRWGSAGKAHAQVLLACGLKGGPSSWMEHDGLIARATQTHPFGDPHTWLPPRADPAGEQVVLPLHKPGVWNVQELEGVDHFNVVSGPLFSNRSAQDLFWGSYLARLRELRPADAPELQGASTEAKDQRKEIAFHLETLPRSPDTPRA